VGNEDRDYTGFFVVGGLPPGSTVIF